MAGTHIAVHGLGYVGTVTAACLSTHGYRVTGVDVKEEKIARINAGESPVEEPGLDDLVADGVETGRLNATTDTTAAITDADVSFVCVGTPVGDDGAVDLSSIEAVTEGIGAGLRADGGDYHTVVLRSTVPPGTTATVTDQLAEGSGRMPGEGFGVVMNPEFIREGSAIDDFNDPPFVVLGSEHDRATAEVLDLYEELSVTPSQIFPVEPEAAELVKYASNAFHALKVAFANEIGRVCKEYGVDGRTVMDVFCQDRKLNISSYYLRPGFSFGGSCLHKDTKALVEFAGDDLPLVNSVLPANDAHTSAALEELLSMDPSTVGIAGISFKPGTDDLRNSQAAHLARALLDRGYDVCMFDPAVDPAELVGSNRQFVDQTLPELEECLVDSLDELVDAADIVAVCNDDSAYEPLVDADVAVFDPVGLFDDGERSAKYRSLCW